MLAGVAAAQAQSAAHRITPAAAQSSPAAQEAVATPVPAVKPSASTDDLDAVKDLLDRFQQAIRGDNQTDETLTLLRERLAPVRDGLRAKLSVLDPRLTEVDSRLSQLGAPPAAGAPPEPEAIASERTQLTQTRANVDAAIKQTRLLAARADEISARINENRRTLFSRALFVRTPGLFDLDFWREAANAVKVEGPGIGSLLRNWSDYIGANGGPAGLVIALVTVIGFAIAAALLLRWVRRRLDALPMRTRIGRAIAAFAVLAREAVTAPLALIVVLKIADGNGLMPAEIGQLGLGFVVAVAVACFGRGIALAVLAPSDPERRLVVASDARAHLMANFLSWSGVALGATIFLNLLHKSVAAPLSATVATSALLSLAVGFLTLHMLIRMQPGETADVPGGKLDAPILRFLAWIFVATLAVSLVTGLIGFAAFLAGRTLVLLAMLATYQLCANFVDALFADVVTAQTARGRHLANVVGVSPRGLELAGTLIAAAIKLVLVLLAILPVVGPWGVFAADFFGVVQDAMLGIRLGGLTISIGALLGAAALIAAGVIATRALQRWLERNFLPRTRLDPGLQNSVSSLLGYAGVIVAIVLGLAELGIDLQKIALIAGALSVGIGFGLQSIVSNFVSGIILLAERPIRVGDRVVVKSEEGIVRRISVRATEIETYDRASVIIPNSDLISGVVKNWTHADTTGQARLHVVVRYDSDVEKVRDILMAATKDHPEVDRSAPPAVQISALGQNGIEFDVFCVVPNVARAGGVQSDIYFDVLRRFRTAGIKLAGTAQQEFWLRSSKDGEMPPAGG
jgi:small-conductance mechanosensitive channel